MKSLFQNSTGLTFDDVLLVPRKSSVKSRKDVDTSSRVTRKIKLKFPVIPANMDTITESPMAIAVAREGSIGIIHRFQSVDREVEEIKKVKQVEDLILYHPICLRPHHTLADLMSQIDRYETYSFLITDPGNHLLGILTRRDYQFITNLSTPISKIMTPVEKLVTAPVGTRINKAKEIISRHRLEKLPLINPDKTIAGLYTAKDILYFESKPDALRDSQQRLMVGGSIGATGDFLERAIALDKAGVDLLLVDVAHGHANHILSAIKTVRSRVPKQQIIAGNVATEEAAKDLIRLGVDAIKVGVGPGSVCTTRLVAGVGVPQLSAIYEVAKICRKNDIPLIADGGTKNSGDIVKALAAGADIVMAGNQFAGTDEAPGDTITISQKVYKIYRGSSTYTSATARNQRGDFGKLAKHQINHVEGAEAIVPYKGPVEGVIAKMIGGISSGLSYCGAHNISQLHQNARFVLVTPNGLRESSHHDVIV